MSVNWDAYKGEASLSLIGDEVENVQAKGLGNCLVVFSDEVSVGSSSKSDSEVRG